MALINAVNLSRSFGQTQVGDWLTLSMETGEFTPEEVFVSLTR